ncbi:MAG: redoxin domain-containing protein [Bacteroidia bacterium]|nr:redoxin domain-containing protein [Bacteroidia bacterium]
MLQIGDKLPEFKLKGFDGKFYTNFDYADKYALAVIFTCNSSPVSIAYAQRLLNLFEKYEDDSMGIVGINSNDALQAPEDGLEQMRHVAGHLGLADLHFLFLQDESQEIARKFGAKVNPEVFLFNRKRELVYKGAIDDCWQNEAMVTSVYLEDAIEETLDGMEIDFPETVAEGTPILWKK